MKIKNNIEISYCSFEVSTLLQEKGFDSDFTNYCYTKDGKLNRATVTNKWIKEDGPYHLTRNICIAPTHELVIEWVRVNFGIYVTINTNSFADEFWYEIRGKGKGKWFMGINQKRPQKATELALLFILKNLIQ